MNLSSPGIDPHIDRPSAGTRSLRTRVKFCGITNLDDAESAIELGVDALGFVFFEHSKRAVTALQASEIVNQLPPYVSIVGLFVNPTKQLVIDTLATVSLDVLQFHGDESADYAAQFNKPYYTVVRVGEDDQNDVGVSAKVAEHSSASGFLFDTFDSKHQGGTGKTFDWSHFDSSVRGAILAGGLDAENVTRAILQTRPYAVDVSSGVEDVPGKKSVTRMREFMLACQVADQQLKSMSISEKVV